MSIGMLWGGVVPVRLDAPAVGVVRDWAAAAGVRRLLLVHDRLDVSDVPGASASQSLVSALEAAGLAVFPFERPGGPTVVSVGDGVGAYHFDGCDGVAGIGSAGVVDLTKAIAMMSGQRHPLTALAAEPGAAEPCGIDPRGVAPSLAIATDLTGIAGLGGSLILLDDQGCPFLLRDRTLCPAAAGYCPGAAGVTALERGLVAAYALDASASDLVEVSGVLPLIDTLVSDTDTAQWAGAAVSVAGLLERRLGPARVLAAYAEVACGVPSGRALAAMLAPACGFQPALTEPVAAAMRLLSAEAASGAAFSVADLPLAALAHLRVEALPTDLLGLVRTLGLEIPAPTRRTGRGAAARSRRAS